jgi:multiple sugar transport system substrate-binding protein
MNKIARKIAVLAAVIVTVAMLAQGISPVHAQTKTTVVWFVGLGTGTNDQQIAAQKKVVSEFNASQSAIDLQVQFGANFQTSMDTITTELASGNGPDIAGPVGVGGSNSLSSQWLDLKDLIAKNKYDLTSFDPALVDLYKTTNGGYSAIPFAVYPSVLYYNQALFDEAGLAYPPTKVGDMYTMPDKTKVPWNYDTVKKIGMLLTVDKNGNDATNAKFDPTNIVQYGLNFQWALMRLVLTDIQPSAFWDGKTVKISADWRTAAAWVQDGIWKSHFISSSTAEASTLLQPSAFDSGKLAMAITPLWYTCCMTDTAGKLKWNMAVVPASLDGKTHIAADADTFRVFKTTKNPDATFTVLSYILDQAVPELAPAYGAFPARPKYQQAFIDSQNKVYTQGVNWAVATSNMSLVNPGSLHHESDFPNFQQGQDRWASFYTLLFGDTGATIDVNKEMDKLQTDLQSIANGTYPTATPVPTAVPTKAS